MSALYRRFIGAAVITVGGLVGLAVASGSAVHDPAWSPKDSRILFYSDREGSFDLYRVELENGLPRRLTDDPGYEGSPAWSPDGTRIAFASDRDGDFEIFVSRPDGTGLEQVTRNGHRDLAPAWSPDGERIVFESLRDDNQDLWVVDLATGEESRLTHHPANDFRPSWCRTDERIVFQSKRSGRYQIHSVRPDGEDLRQVSSVEGDLVDPSCGPVTGRILASLAEDPHSAAIVVLGEDGRIARRLTEGGELALAPEWSGDERFVVFATGGQDAGLFVIRSDGTERRRLEGEDSTPDGS